MKTINYVRNEVWLGEILLDRGRSCNHLSVNQPFFNRTIQTLLAFKPLKCEHLLLFLVLTVNLIDNLWILGRWREKNLDFTSTKD